MNEMPPPLPATGRKKPAYLIVIYVVLGLVAFVVVTGGIGIWLFLRSETGQKIVSTVGRSVTLFQQASSAPGTEQLRAHGCNRAMVIPFDRMAEIFREIAPENDRDLDPSRLPGDGTMVVCQVTADASSAPACADVARIYAGAVANAPERFGVQVQGRRKSVCDGTYTRDGTFVEPLENRDRPRAVERTP